MAGRVALLPFMFLSFVIASAAWAEPKEDVAATTARWAQVFAQNDPDQIVREAFGL